MREHKNLDFKNSIGYLTAPKSGKDTRNDLLEAANDQTKGLKDQWDKTVSQAKETFDNVLSQVDRTANKVENKYDDLKDDAKSAYNQARVKQGYDDKVGDLADAAKSGVNKAEDALKIN